MPREVIRRHSSSDIFQWDSKENKLLTTTPKKKNYQNVTIRKLTQTVNQSSKLNTAFIPSKIPVFIDKSERKNETGKEISHSQDNISGENSTIEKIVNVPTKRTRLRRSVSEKILPFIEVYERVNHRELRSNQEVSKFLHKRVEQLQKAENFVNEIETPIGVFNKPIPYTPVKIKHRRSKSHKLKSAVNITAQLFQYSDDIIQFYEKQEDDNRKKIFSGLKFRLVSKHEWQNSVNNIVTLAIKLHFPPALAYHAIRIMDDLFCMGVLEDVPPRLLEITALWLIAKKDYVYNKLPTIEEVIQHSSIFFTLKELIDCEWKILQNLNFNINYPDVISIIMYNVKTYYGCDYLHAKFGSYYYVGAYMLDILLFNRKIIQKSSLLMAGVISSFTRIILNSKFNNFETKEIDYWIPDRIKISFPEAEKNFIIENLLEGIKNSLNKKYRENIIFKKYEKLRYNQISNIIKKTFAKN